MNKITIRTLLPLIFLTVFYSGCSKTPTEERKHFVNIYAKALLFYESEKIGRRLPDSLYQRKLEDYLDSLHTSKSEFQDNARQFSADVNEWKEFLGEVNRAVDSLKISLQK